MRSQCGGEAARWAATLREAASRLVPTCRREATSEGSDCRRHEVASESKGSPA
ncbi:hypothetical protein [Chlorogloeopsis fritschii]|uniref:hypothetical protein n=1 Tax=Chlorogloeopsis fritschii TaxID=1124 RepID=UPI00191CF2B6|nr:hypothetical protein [Chlorogloeopsis fritschii]